MVYSIIKKSQLAATHRLDAEYYQPEYLDIAEKLNIHTTIKLGDFCKIADGDHTKTPPLVKRGGFRYLRAKELRNFFIDNSDPVYVSKSYFQKIKRSHIKPFDVVLSIMGTVGNLAVILPHDGIMTANRAVSIISPKSKDLFSSYCVAVYLESKFGVSQRERESMGGVQQRVNLEDLANIKIPIIPKIKQQKVDEIFQKAISQHKLSENFYSQAENLLLEELGLKDFEVENDLSYIINLSDVKSAHRADAEYFQPKYERFISKVKGQNAKLLKELVSRIKTKIKPKTEEIYKYIEISDINIGNGDADFNEMIGKKLPASARIPIKGGEFLISKVRPTRGAIAILPEDFNKNFICSGAFSVFKAPEILKEYLFVVLRSIIGKLQFEKPTTGTSYPTITDEDVENILIPILPKPTQRKIAELVRKSHTARKKAKELLEQAKEKVEQLIEQGA